MTDPGAFTLAAQPDRVRVFVTSTIGECAKQRREALAAIRDLDLGSFVFEREGARPYGPRALYLAKLSTCHMAVGIYRSSYGWVDTASGQTLSGLEDEYREIERLGLDLLPYIETTEARDPRLAQLVDDVLSKRTARFFVDSDDIEPWVRSDLLALLSQTYSRQRMEASRRAVAPSLTLDAIFRLVPYRVRRSTLYDRLREHLATSRMVWVTGEAGAGKTVLVAEYAADTNAAYVNARGLEPRELLAKGAEALRRSSSGDSDPPRTYDEARAIFREAWLNADQWPLVIDDPIDPEAVWRELAPLLRGSTSGSVIIATRVAPAGATGATLGVVGFDAEELGQLERVVASDAQRNLAALSNASGAVLPIVAREIIDPAAKGREEQERPVEARFRALDGGVRDLVAYVALSPIALTLEDLVELQGNASLGQVHDLAAQASHFLVEDAFGYALLHESWGESIRAELATSPQYRSSLNERLIDRLAGLGLYFAAFLAARGHDDSRAALFARRSLRAVVFTGSIRDLTDALEFLVERDRETGDKAQLAVDLIFLAQMSSHTRGASYCAPMIEEAASIAAQLDDPYLFSFVTDFQASYTLQTTGSPEAFVVVRTAREAYEAKGDLSAAGRLLIDEAVGYMAITEGDRAAPLLRTAMGYFEQLGDKYGRDVAARNLATVLFSIDGASEEASALIASLETNSTEGDRHRAWECNVLNKQYRKELRYDEAEAVAREAIEIGEQLGDRYLVAINLICLGNTFRDRKDSANAIPAYEAAGVEAAAISRPDIDGRAARLTAAAYNDLVRAEVDPRANAEKAEAFARHAIGVLRDSVATYDLADAWDELGSALATLGREEEAWSADARSALLFATAGEVEIAGQLRRSLARALRDRSLGEVATYLLESFGIHPDRERPQVALWADIVRIAIENAELEALPSILSLLVRKLHETIPPALHDHALDALLREVMGGLETRQPARRPMLLFAILAWFRDENMTPHRLLRYASLCLEDEPALRMRTTLDDDLHLAIEIGRERQHLFTFHSDLAQADEIFLALCLASFVAVFGDVISETFIAPRASGPQAFEVVVMSIAAAPTDMVEQMRNLLRELPVAMVGFVRTEGEHPTIAAMARADLLSTMETSAERVGTFEMVQMMLLQAVIDYCLGGNLEELKDECVELSKRLLF